MNVRPYQREARNRALAEWDQNDSTLIVMPTGTGKTIVAADIVRSVFPKRVLFLAHRKELIFQAKDKIESFTGIGCAVEMGNERADLNGLFGNTYVVVSSIQTQCSGGDGSGRMTRFDPNTFGCIIIDEAHHAVSPSFKRLLAYYRSNPNVKILGITATPDRSDEEALGQVFDTVAFDYEILDAINDGWLVPVRQQMVNVSGLDFSQIRTTAGDLNGADLAEVMESERNLQEIAGPTIDIIGDRRTLVFASSVKHSRQLSEIFNRHKSGMAEWVCGETPPEDRAATLARFKSGEVQVVVNCAVLTEGFDNPAVQVVAHARPTKSRGLFAQMTGRATRPLPGTVDGQDTAEERRASIAASAKPFMLSIDFVGNSGRHKLITAADILGGNVSDEAIARAILRAKKAGGSVSVSEVLEEEEERIKAEAEERKRAEIARRVRLVAKAQYNSRDVDPFDVFSITPAKSRGWDTGKTLSKKQADMLLSQGIDPSKLSYSEGRSLLNEIFRRFGSDMCSFKQAKVLQRYGYSTEVTRAEASRIMDALKANGWRRPAEEVAA